ncbi:MAG: DUF1499 domain-containing protein [Gammaproteobacteria bacterium]|nr:DUF1499 domain-containing protein [Gammaproteobacteria bacterium]
MIRKFPDCHKQSPLIVLPLIFFLALPNLTAAELKHNQPPTGLPSCPDSPNCVSSLSNDNKHRVQALQYHDVSAQEAMSILYQVLTDMTNPVRQVTEHQYYHAQFNSTVFGFVDDVYCLLNTGKTHIDIYSASRTGYYDFGVNRKRVEQIRTQFNQKLEQATSKR